MFLWVLWATPVKQSNPRSELLKPLVYNWSVRVTTCTCGWYQEQRAVLWDWALTYGIWCYLQVDSVRIELNGRTSTWYQSIALWCGKTLPIEIGVLRTFMDMSHFIYPLIGWWAFWLFLFWAIINILARNICVKDFVWVYVLSWIAGSCDNSIF